MKSLLSVPLLPDKKVDSVLISDEYPEIIQALEDQYQIQTVKIIKNSDLDPAISSHTDCSFVQLDEHTVLTESNNYNNIVNYLTSKAGESDSEFNILCIKDHIKSPYPNDVRLNIKIIGKRIICNTYFIADEIKDFAKKHDYQLIHANQGYAACSSVVLNDNALITDDESIYASSLNIGIDTLLINKGSVRLKGYDYGFIGGTCGMIDKNLLAFTGKLSSHSNYKDIIDFLNKHNIRYIELSKEPLTDIGGIIPILQ